MFEDLKGKTIVEVLGATGDNEMTFVCSDGEQFKMYHEQDCCESVYIEDICGDINDIMNAPIVVAEENSEADPNASESGTWTFYKLDTVKGGVTIRWYGCSNGYYSERVSVYRSKLAD